MHINTTLSSSIIGFKFIHSKHICHLDIKPENIILDRDFWPRITDFGFSKKFIDANKKEVLVEIDKGTKQYVAPEIWAGKKFKGDKADIFSLGVILLNLVTKKIGFLKSSKSDPYYKYISARLYKLYWKKVKNQIGEISDELKDLYIKMVSFNPDERPTIDEIFKHPWMKEIQDLNESEYKILEKEVFDEFKILEENL